MEHKFNLVLSADYQMGKLVPYWGQSPQPGSTYYLQKFRPWHLPNSELCYRVICSVRIQRAGWTKNHRSHSSYMAHYLGTIPAWLHWIHLFLDNTCSTNKNYYLMGWAMELVQQWKVNFLRISSWSLVIQNSVPTFSKIAKSHNSWDVFTTSELQNVIGPYASVTVDDRSLVLAWRDAVSCKYSKFPGIRSLHEFLLTKNTVTRTVTAKTHTLCYTGSFQGATICGKNALNIISEESQSYSSLDKTRTLSSSKTGTFETNVPQLHSSWASPTIDFVIITLASHLCSFVQSLTTLLFLYSHFRE